MDYFAVMNYAIAGFYSLFPRAMIVLLVRERSVPFLQVVLGEFYRDQKYFRRIALVNCICDLFVRNVLYIRSRIHYLVSKL